MNEYNIMYANIMDGALLNHEDRQRRDEEEQALKQREEERALQ